MKRTLLILVVLLSLLLAPLSAARPTAARQQPTPDTSEPEPPTDKTQAVERAVVAEAVRQAAASRGAALYAPTSGVEYRVENVQFSADGNRLLVLTRDEVLRAPVGSLCGTGGEE